MSTSTNSRLAEVCQICASYPQDEQGCADCLGTGIGSPEVREACRTLVAAALQIQKRDVTPAHIHEFWMRLIDQMETTHG